MAIRQCIYFEKEVINGVEINEQLKFIRQQKRLTQKQVADAIGIDKSTYAHYESGRRVPNAKTWVALSNFFGFPVFPAQIQIVYPEGLLEKFEKCIKENGQPTGDFNTNRERFMKIGNSLNEIYKVHEEAMDTSALPIDALVNQSIDTPFTVMTVTLDVRAERLIGEAVKCMNALIADNEK